MPYARRGEDGADDLLAATAALRLQETLERILEGEPPCDIYARWKSIEQQPMGGNPDINDGVRINIRPFMLADDVGRKAAGVLRDRPNTNGSEDRGTDPEDAPWYELGPKYGGKKGDRINDHHLTVHDKKTSRAATANDMRPGKNGAGEKV